MRTSQALCTGSSWWPYFKLFWLGPLDKEHFISLSHQGAQQKTKHGCPQLKGFLFVCFFNTSSIWCLWIPYQYQTVTWIWRFYYSHFYQKSQEIAKRNGFCLQFSSELGKYGGRGMFLSPHFSYSSVTVYRKEETKVRKQVYICMCRLNCEINKPMSHLFWQGAVLVGFRLFSSPTLDCLERLKFFRVHDTLW